MSRRSAEELAAGLVCSIFERELNLRLIFDKLDVKRSGTLDRQEFGTAFVEFGYDDVSQAEISDVFALFDADGTGRISLREFTEALVDYGGNCPAPSTSTKGPLPPPVLSPAWRRRSSRLAEDATDGEVMDELSERLASKRIPFHRLFGASCREGSKGMMDDEDLRRLLTSVGLAFTFATNEQEAAARGHESPPPPPSHQHQHQQSRGPPRRRVSAAEALRTGDASEEAIHALLPIIRAKISEHNLGTDRSGEFFLALDEDRSGFISPSELLDKFWSWGITVTQEQAVHLLEPFDVDATGRLNFEQLCQWLFWAEDSEPSLSSSTPGWRRSGPDDRRVWAAAGTRVGRVGRIHRLMQMIDATHNGKIECFEFVRALSKRDDYDRPYVSLTARDALARPPSPPPPSSYTASTESTTDDEEEHGSESAARRVTAELASQLHGGSQVQDAFSKVILGRAVGGSLDLSGVKAVLKATGLPTRRAEALMPTKEHEGNRLPVWKLLELIEAVEHDNNGEDLPTPPPRHHERPSSVPRGSMKSQGGEEEEYEEGEYGDDEEAATAEYEGEGEDGEGGFSCSFWEPDEPRLSQEEPASQTKTAEELAALAKAAVAAPVMGASELAKAETLDRITLEVLRRDLRRRASTLADAFAVVDLDQTGRVTLLEFRKALQRAAANCPFDLEVGADDTVRLFNHFDQDRTGNLDYNQLITLLKPTTKLRYRRPPAAAPTKAPTQSSKNEGKNKAHTD